MDTENQALRQADAQMESVRAMVAALDVDYDRIGELEDEQQGLKGDWDGLSLLDAPPEFLEWESEYGGELDDLREQSNGCADRDEAEQRIHEDALSVEVRSEWATSEDEFEAGEFRIVLCTGGPHVQIRGRLYGGTVERAWLEYQGWGTPMTERVNKPGDQYALIDYANCFYFGE